jgi:hypothetical protein
MSGLWRSRRAIICANTPQAKGRVERMNRTLQDRLVKELRLQGVCGEAVVNLVITISGV